MLTFTSHLKWTDCNGSKQALVGEIFFMVGKFSFESHYVKSKCCNAWFSMVCTGVDLWSDHYFPNFALLLVNGWSRKRRSLALWNGQWKRQRQQGQAQKCRWWVNQLRVRVRGSLERCVTWGVVQRHIKCPTTTRKSTTSNITSKSWFVGFLVCLFSVDMASDLPFKR